MSEFRVKDEAHLFRIEISGRLAGKTVEQVHACWQSALDRDPSRRITVDLSSMTGYDVSGFRLLRSLEKHGTYLAARNPEALSFLHQISSPEVTGPTLVSDTARAARRKSGKVDVPTIARAAEAS